MKTYFDLFVIGDSTPHKLSMEGSKLRKSSTRDNEDNISIFFDFGTPTMESQALKNGGASSSTPQSQESGNRGGIRVSLACIPVRTKKVIMA